MENTKLRASQKYKKRSTFDSIWRQLRKNKGAIVGMILLVVIIIIALVSPYIFNYETDVIANNVKERMQHPSSEHWFGTDDLGRDIFARVCYGARYSLAVGLVAVAVALVVGVTLGAAAGYVGGVFENLIMRVCDIFSSIPSVLMAIAVVSALGKSTFNLMLAVGIASTAPFIRVARAAVLTVRGEEYVESARAIGSPEWKIVAFHILPNCVSQIIVQATLRVGSAIISAAQLSFLGLGVAAPAPEWGSMLSAGRAYIRDYSYMTLFPGIAIMLTVLSLNLIGDGLRDALDPKLKGGYEMSHEHDNLILDIENLVVRYETEDGIVHALNGIDLQLGYHQTIGLVGETGAGKTTAALAMMRLVPSPPGVVECDKLMVDGRDILNLPTAKMEEVRGKDVSMIFQDPMTALNPVFTVGEQIAESLELHEHLDKKAAMERAKEMLELVGIPGSRANEYPHQFSGGMKQRVVIAIALACNPKLLIADEPTTALDHDPHHP